MNVLSLYTILLRQISDLLVSCHTSELRRGLNESRGHHSTLSLQRLGFPWVIVEAISGDAALLAEGPCTTVDNARIADEYGSSCAPTSERQADKVAGIQRQGPGRKYMGDRARVDAWRLC